MIVVVLLFLVGCGTGGGSGGGTSGGTSAPKGDGIVIKNFMFMPMSLTVSPKASITVTNEDSATHTLTATGKAFDSGDIGPGKTVTITAPDKPGTYSYLCDIHQYMTGSIIVR